MRQNTRKCAEKDYKRLQPRAKAAIGSGVPLSKRVKDTGTNMDTAAPAMRRYPDKLWKEVETRACTGIGLQALSDAYGISVATINDRSKRFKWMTPGRLARQRKAALSGKKESVGEEIEKHALAEQRSLPAPVAAVVALAHASPAEFNAAFAKAAQYFIAQGIQNMPAPRTLADLRTWNEIHRKAAGLDAKDSVKPALVLTVNAPRSLSRTRSLTVDV